MVFLHYMVTFSQLSDKELPKFQFGWFPTMDKFGLPLHLEFLNFKLDFMQ